ncbi:MAG: transporter substrate-binding domain-containing protein [Desulfovibrionaceae bacterium]|nr:transporter substrate-binding domain-containing protein [Desulfovibrionaceae bacterium]
MSRISRIRAAVCCFIALFLACPLQAEARSFTVFTNNAPPFKFLKDGKPSGMAGDLLMHLLKITGHAVARTRATTMNHFLESDYRQKDAVFLSLSQKHQQGNRFKWVGPIFTATSGIVVKRSRRIRLARISDAKTLVLSSVIDSGPERTLLGAALSEQRFLRFKRPEEAVMALVNDQADGLLLATAAAYWFLGRQGIDTSDYETALTLDPIPLYFAFHPDTPDAVIEELQKALDAMRQTDAEGMSPYLKIVSKYY